MKLVGCSTERPQISTSSAGVRLSMQGQQKYYVLLENGAYVYTFTLGVVRKKNNNWTHEQAEAK